jgi:hypothetical protein
MPIFNGTITSGGTAQLVVGACTSYFIRNESTGDLRITDDGQIPSSSLGILLPAGESISDDRPSGPLQIWGATTLQAFSGKYLTK